MSEVIYSASTFFPPSHSAMDVSKEQNVSMKFCWKLGKMAGFATIRIGETALGSFQKFQWYFHFTNSPTSFDDPHKGSPSTA
jgi:hypothetical protein